MALSPKKTLLARDLLIDTLYRWNPGRGCAAATAEAARRLGGKGRAAVAEAERTIAAKKAAKKIAEVSLRSRVAAEIRESLTAAQMPSTPTEGGQALQAGAADPLAIGADRQSPFWRGTAATAAEGSAPDPGRPLHELSNDEFQAHAGDAFGAYGRAAGYASPLWK